VLSQRDTNRERAARDRHRHECTNAHRISPSADECDERPDIHVPAWESAQKDDHRERTAERDCVDST
jgi:hypothetical protein